MNPEGAEGVSKLQVPLKVSFFVTFFPKGDGGPIEGCSAQCYTAQIHWVRQLCKFLYVC